MIGSSPGRHGWVRLMNSILMPGPPLGFKVLDLFSGAGGLSLGFWAAGFDVLGVDSSPDAAKSYSLNFGRAICSDLNDMNEYPEADVLVAGPPCQPWSRAGKRLGENDGRDGFEITLRWVKSTAPVAIVVENVPDISRTGSRQHLDYFEASLTTLGYQVAEHILNAADYGVPQNRRRLFVTAIRDDEPLAPPVAHVQQTTVRQAIPGRHLRTAAGSRVLSDSMSAYIERYERASGCRIPRDVHSDRPCRTLTVRNLCGATGDMLRLRMPDGSRRTLTVLEAARIQSFPDWFRFRGNERSRFEQIGNAVPPLMALAVAKMVRIRLLGLGDGELSDNMYPHPSSTAASATMRANRRRDTGPERRLRSALHRQGWRFRVDMPINAGGRKVRPDIVFTKRRVAIFVDGCFWHGCLEHGGQPRSNASYWNAKLMRNIQRDQEDSRDLESAGWKVVRVWEHYPVSDAIAMVNDVLTAARE